MSETNIIYNVGPRIDPCGTPVEIYLPFMFQRISL